MIRKIKLENFKSVQQLELDLGRFNVFIGANGSGKSNVLEGITFGCSGMSGNLGDEFLATRGVRVAEPDLMRAAFQADASQTDIRFSLYNEKQENVDCSFQWAGKWQSSPLISKTNGTIFVGHPFFDRFVIKNGISFFDGEPIQNQSNVSQTMRDLYLESLKHVSLALKNYTQINDLEHFAIFAPENYFLRNAFTENQLKPLGIRGEGLFKHLADLSLRKPLIFNEIKENLNLIDWYEDLEFDLTSDGYFTGRIKIKDVYLKEGAKYFNAHSANEGFLYLLFYLTLFSSDKTPAFFAIDNIDNALNPKLASDLILLLVRLAAKYNKQAIVTTHNPAILDGLNLHDAEQRLLVLWRNANGHTKAKRIEKKQLSPTGASVKLSEQFLRGYIGGLNF